MEHSEQSQSQTKLTLVAESEMTIYQAAEMKSVLLEPFNKASVVEVDLSAVTEIDVAGIQLLLMMKKAAKAKQCELKLCRHSPAVLEAFELANLAAFFGDPLVMQSSGKTAAGQTFARSANES
jgi:anti-anti-sigma factor